MGATDVVLVGSTEPIGATTFSVTDALSSVTVVTGCIGLVVVTLGCNTVVVSLTLVAMLVTNVLLFSVTTSDPILLTEVAIPPPISLSVVELTSVLLIVEGVVVLASIPAGVGDIAVGREVLGGRLVLASTGGGAVVVTLT